MMHFYAEPLTGGEFKSFGQVDSYKGKGGSISLTPLSHAVWEHHNLSSRS